MQQRKYEYSEASKLLLTTRTQVIKLRLTDAELSLPRPFVIC